MKVSPDGYASALACKRDILSQAEPDLAKLITVVALDQAAFDLNARQYGQPTMASACQVRTAIKVAQDDSLGAAFTPQFLSEEWDEPVEPTKPNDICSTWPAPDRATA